MFYNLSKMENIDCTIIYACLTSHGYEEYIKKYFIIILKKKKLMKMIYIKNIKYI